MTTATQTSWLPTLHTATPEEGFELATKLARRGVAITQPDADVRARLRPAYAEDTAQLIASSQTIAMYFQVVAAANDHWRG